MNLERLRFGTDVKGATTFSTSLFSMVKVSEWGKLSWQIYHNDLRGCKGQKAIKLFSLKPFMNHRNKLDCKLLRI